MIGELIGVFCATMFLSVIIINYFLARKHSLEGIDDKLSEILREKNSIYYIKNNENIDLTTEDYNNRTVETFASTDYTISKEKIEELGFVAVKDLCKEWYDEFGKPCFEYTFKLESSPDYILLNYRSWHFTNYESCTTGEFDSSNRRLITIKHVGFGNTTNTLFDGELIHIVQLKNLLKQLNISYEIKS